jgi:hypothetical protein
VSLKIVASIRHVGQRSPRTAVSVTAS